MKVEDMKLCDNCRYHKRELYESPCDKCFEVGLVMGNFSTEFEQKKERKEHDIFVLWYSRFGEIITYCKRHILHAKAWLASHS